MTKKVLIVIVFLLYINTSMAALVHGNVYDLSLNKLNNVVVEVNSNPKQSFVVKDSEYKFNLNIGTYVIKASYIKNKELIASTEENIVIIDPNGDYNLDLILFPNIDDELLNQTDLNIEDINGNSTKFRILIIFLILSSLAVVLYFVLKVKKKPEQEQLSEIKETESFRDEVVEKVLEILNREKRINQKDLRKELNLSEAKISLVVAQLESEGKVKKFKKGRGNIIILNK